MWPRPCLSGLAHEQGVPRTRGSLMGWPASHSRGREGEAQLALAHAWPPRPVCAQCPSPPFSSVGSVLSGVQTRSSGQGPQDRVCNGGCGHGLPALWRVDPQFGVPGHLSPRRLPALPRGSYRRHCSHVQRRGQRPRASATSEGPPSNRICSLLLPLPWAEGGRGLFRWGGRGVRTAKAPSAS